MNRLTRHPLLADLLLTLVLLALGMIGSHGSDRWIAAALTLPLIWRRREPFVVFTVISVVAFGQWLATSTSPRTSPYSSPSTRSRRRSRAAG